MSVECRSKKIKRRKRGASLCSVGKPRGRKGVPTRYSIGGTAKYVHLGGKGRCN